MKLSEMSTETLAELTKRILSISKKETFPVVQDHALLVKLEATATKYLEVFDKLTYSGLGKSVAEADLLRDSLFVSFRDIISGFSDMKGLSLQQTATDIKKIIAKYGNTMQKLSYGDQSSHLDKLIEELDISTNQTKISQLHLSESYALLKNSQQAFSAIFHEQIIANAELRSKLSASSLSQELTTDIRNYLNFVDAMGNIDPAWKGLSLELNEVLKAAKSRNLNREAVEEAVDVK